MDDKLKVFWNLDVLVKMCRSKSDGPSLRIEEVELIEKIKAHKQEIEEIALQTEEESYDTSAEMADRNIEIITKKQLQTLKSDLKDKNKILSSLKDEEESLYKNNTLLKETKNSQEKYIISMQERVSEATNYEVIDRYNSLIAETTEKAAMLCDEIEEQTELYNKVQEDIVETTNIISALEDKIDKKKKLLAETQANLENKDNYIDKSKKEKNNKKIEDLNSKINKLTKRLEELRKDPKYLESRIKDVINNREDANNAKGFLIDLINIVIKQPYINVPADKSLEEELLKATQARDTFANEVDQKSYNILEANTPEKLRIEFLTERIAKWQNELDTLKSQVEKVDKDQEFGYETKNQLLYDMINTMKLDLKEFQKAYDDTPETNISYKASLRAQLDEKSNDIVEAEKIATAFRKDESEDIAKATRTMKYECEQITQNILRAEQEISEIRNRLTTKKSGLIDIATKNKDKDTLKELAQTVIDIKHRRQFPETPVEIIERLEELLEIELLKEIDNTIIENNSNIISKNYDSITTPVSETPVGIKVETDITTTDPTPKRGIRVVEETIITNPIEEETEDDEEIDGFVSVDIPEYPETENELVEESTIEPEIQEEYNDNSQPELTEEELEDAQLDQEIDNIIESNQIEETPEPEDEPLDIGAFITPEEPKQEDNNLSINSMFNNTNNDKNDNIVSDDELSDELNKFLKEFMNKDN